MFDRCITFTVSYFPEDSTLRVDCLNSRDPYVIWCKCHDLDVHGFYSAVACALRDFVETNEYDDFFEVK